MYKNHWIPHALDAQTWNLNLTNFTEHSYVRERRDSKPINWNGKFSSSIVRHPLINSGHEWTHSLDGLRAVACDISCPVCIILQWIIYKLVVKKNPLQIPPEIDFLAKKDWILTFFVLLYLPQ